MKPIIASPLFAVPYPSLICYQGASIVPSTVYVLVYRKNSSTYTEGFENPAPVFFPATPVSERSPLDCVSAFQLETLRQNIISKPPLCASKALFPVLHHASSQSYPKRLEDIDLANDLIESNMIKSKDRTFGTSLNRLERRQKVIKFLEKARLRREMHPANRNYEGRSRAALSRARNKGKFTKIFS